MERTGSFEDIKELQSDCPGTRPKPCTCPLPHLPLAITSLGNDSATRRCGYIRTAGCTAENNESTLGYCRARAGSRTKYIPRFETLGSLPNCADATEIFVGSETPAMYESVPRKNRPVAQIHRDCVCRGNRGRDWRGVQEIHRTAARWSRRERPEWVVCLVL
jgi:hypothetical protein